MSLPSSSELQAVPREHINTPAGVADRLREELQLERARVRMMQARENEAWAQVERLRADLQFAQTTATAAAAAATPSPTKHGAADSSAAAGSTVRDSTDTLAATDDGVYRRPPLRNAAVQCTPDEGEEERRWQYTAAAADVVAALDRLTAAADEAHTAFVSTEAEMTPLTTALEVPSVEVQRLVVSALRDVRGGGGYQFNDAGVDASGKPPRPPAAAVTATGANSQQQQQHLDPSAPASSVANPLVPAVVERVARLFCEGQRLRQTVAELQRDAARWKLWATEAIERSDVWLARADDLAAAYQRDSAELMATALDRQTQLDDIVRNGPPTTSATARHTGGSTVGPTTAPRLPDFAAAASRDDSDRQPSSHHSGGGEFSARRRREEARAFVASAASTVEKAVASANEALAMAKDLRVAHRAERRTLAAVQRSRGIELRVTKALHGAPPHAYLFENFLRRAWGDANNANRRGGASASQVTGDSLANPTAAPGEASNDTHPDTDVAATSGVNVDVMVRVWREMQLHAAEFVMASGALDVLSMMSSSSPAAAVVVDTESPLVSSSATTPGQRAAAASNFAGWTHGQLVYVCRLAADHLVESSDLGRRLALRRPFGDSATPTWNADAARIADALDRFSGGFIPSTQTDFVGFFVLFASHSLSARAGSSSSAADAVGEDQLSSVPDDSSSAPSMVATGKRLEDLLVAESELERLRAEWENEKMRADTLQSAHHALVALQHEERLQLEASCDARTSRSLDEALRRCPDTFSIYTTLRCDPELCCTCDVDRIVSLLRRSMERPPDTLSNAEFERVMLDVAADRISETLRRTSSSSLVDKDALPLLLWYMSPREFIYLMGRVRFQDERGALSVLQLYFRFAVRVASELTHHDVAQLLLLVRFAWLPARDVEELIGELQSNRGIGLPSALLTPTTTTPEQGDEEVPGTYAAFLTQLESAVSAAARLKLLALSFERSVEYAGIPGVDSARDGTPLAAAQRLGITGVSISSAAEADDHLLIVPRPEHWLVEKSAAAAMLTEGRGTSPHHHSSWQDLAHLAAHDWHTFSTLQRWLEASSSSSTA